MNLSRAAKKFQTQMPREAPKPGKEKKAKARPAPEPVVQQAAPPPAPVAAAPTVEPTPVPVATAQASEPTPVAVAQPKQPWPVKTKRPRFVRENVERQERPAAAPLPPRSTKFTAKLLTKNLALPPKDDGPQTARA